MLAVAAPLGWHLAHQQPGGLRPGTAAVLASVTPGAGSPSDSAGSSAAAGPLAPAAVTPTPASAAASPPVWLSITALQIDAPVIAEGVSSDGQMAIPERIDTLGWYKWGPAPGAGAGSIVIVGHVDSAVDGLGAFFTLKNIPDGAAIAVTTADHRIHRYRVVARESFAKSNEPLAALFARTGAPRLTLITCGGTFNRATHSYDDNIVVTARPS